jgi:fructose-bisphosphate aldolase class I
LDGDHPIEVCQQVSEKVLGETFYALQKLGVLLEGMVLKPNMITKGADCNEKTSSK